jgi:acyl dehydratase
MLNLKIEELPSAAGRDLGSSGWLTVDQNRITTFAEATEDRQWIHIDPERAQAGPFGAPIAHGYLTLSLISAVLQELLVVDGATSAVNYGLNKARFPSPVRVGSQVRGSVRIAATRQLPQGFEVITDVVIEVEGEAKPACVAEVVTWYIR